jgi:hypothetical protein
MRSCSRKSGKIGRNLGKLMWVCNSTGDGVFIPQDIIEDAIEEFRQEAGHEVNKVDEIEDEEQEGEEEEEGEGCSVDGDVEIQMDGYDEDQMEGDVGGDMAQ